MASIGTQRRHHSHEHYLSYVVPPYEHGYKCDICGNSGKGLVWHCQPCSYDLCDNCIRPTEVQPPLSAVQGFDESAFKARVNNALTRVRTILENARTPTLASEVHHEYEDKFLLAEYIGNTTIAAILQTLDSIGMTEKAYQQMKEWSAKRTVTLRLKAEETCKFLRKTVREVESDTKYVSNSTLFGKSESYTVTKITEWFWAFEARYELIAFMGNEPEKGIVIAARSGATELKTTTEATPRPASVVRPNIDVNITWLFAHVEATGRAPRFAITRGVKSCRTPRRNEDVDGALAFLVSLFSWCRSVYTYFTRELWPADPDHGLDLSGIKDTGLFVPVIPLFDKSFQAPAANGKGTGVVPIAYIGPFLGEQQRSIAERFGELAKVYPAQGKLITLQEARLLVMLLHLQKVCSAFGEGVDSIENMLHRQLVAAIGKEVHPLDFANYMRFHNRKLFRGEFLPLPFSYAVRRAGHDPEGTLSIEATPVDGSVSEPIQTIVRHTANARPMKFALDASTEVRFGGDRFLHGFVSHQFGGLSGSSLSLRARARQFSSYIVLVGSIASAELFVPKYGIIVANKDELLIPLNLETIPTPKEFKDAIESLSPEQQRFAKAFRSMQLESTLFGVCVIQIKPQLERLLNLPPDALTKEIQLAQDLQTLFIEYQMPSDLLSYDGDKDAPLAAKVARVKQLRDNMMGTVNREREEQLRIEREKQALRLAEEQRRRREEEERRRREEEERRRRDQEELRRREEVEERRMETSVRYEKSSASSGKSLLNAVSNVFQRATSPRSPRLESAKMSSMASFDAPAMAMPAAPAPVVVNAPSAKAVEAAAPAPADGKPSAEAKPEAAKPKEQGKEQGKEQQAKQQEVAEVEAEDLTKVPQEMERKFEALDEDSALRPTIISAGNTWTKRYQKALLASPEETVLGKDEQGKERNRAFDLLDALTKSGAMPVAEADLHVVIAATHCFEKTLMQTVVQDSVNPIEKVERSALIVATSVHRRPAAALIQQEQVERVALYSPKLIDAAALAAAAAPAPLLSSVALQPIAK